MSSTYLDQRLKIFISYRREEVTIDFAGRLYEDLQSRGYNPIRDAEDFTPGNFLSDDITNTITSCDVMIIIVSQKYSQSDWCYKELALACAKDKKLIIIRRQTDRECNISPRVQFYLNGHYFLECIRDEDYENTFAKVLRTLGQVNNIANMYIVY